ncbi:hypothetical protein [Haladaptatus sp. NG-SE-30]
MDWRYLARSCGLYTILFGGGTVTIAYVLPSSVRGYALLGAIAVGLLLLGRAVSSGENGPISGGTPAGASTALSSSGSNDVFDPPDRASARAWSVFYGIGLLVFGIVAISTLL